jgi:hypothetical protein
MVTSIATQPIRMLERFTNRERTIDMAGHLSEQLLSIYPGIAGTG